MMRADGATLEYVLPADAASADCFRSMSFPAYRHLLDFDPGCAPPVVAGVMRDTDPAGLALGVAPDAAAGQLLSLYVAPAARNRGVASGLLQALESAFAARGVRALSATYMSGQASTAALERVLAKRGWSAPSARMLVVRCSLESIRAAPWIARSRLPSGCEIARWIDLTPAERSELRASHECERWIEPTLVPFDHEPGFEPHTSLALRVNGMVRGWCLTHAVESMLRFTCSFVHPRLQRMARVLLLYREAVARMPDIGASVGMWTVPLRHAGMAAFAERHMRPYAIFFGETRGVEKTLAVQA